MKFRFSCFLVLFVGAVSTIYGQAESPPSLSETLKFIEGKVNAARLPCYTNVNHTRDNYKWMLGPIRQQVGFTGTLLVLEFEDKNEFTGSKAGFLYVKGTKKVDLKELSADTIEIDTPDKGRERAQKQPSYIQITQSGCFTLTVSTFNSSKSVMVDKEVTARDMKYIGQNDQFRDTKPEHSVSLYFGSEDTASRVAKALKHAIQLAGGKKEAF